MKITLTNFSNLSKLNIKNISAFEHGKANSIEYLYYYFILSDEELKKDFNKGLFNIF